MMRNISKAIISGREKNQRALEGIREFNLVKPDC
jgi:hypothetical protein